MVFGVGEAVGIGAGFDDVADYRRGVRTTAVISNVSPYTRGTTTSFAPTVYGHVAAGTTDYTGGTQSGSMEVRDGIVWYRFRIKGTIGAGVSGNLRIGNLPYPPGATVVSLGHGALSRVVGFPTATHTYGANGTASPLVLIPFTAAAAEVAATAGTAFEFFGEVACPFTYPS